VQRSLSHLEDAALIGLAIDQRQKLHSGLG
jgi:hypothetical protein